VANIVGAAGTLTSSIPDAGVLDTDALQPLISNDVELAARIDLRPRVVVGAAALRLIEPVAGQGAITLGYATSGDGGGGTWYYDSADATTADNGGTVLVTSGGKRWKRAHDRGEVQAEWFGALPGGSAVGSNVAAAIAAVGSRGTVKFGPGSFNLTGLGAVTTPVQIVGSGSSQDGDSAKTTLTGGIQFNACKGPQIRNLSITGGNYGIYLHDVWYATIEDVEVSGATSSGIFIHSDNNAIGSYYCTLNRVRSRMNGNHGLETYAPNVNDVTTLTVIEGKFNSNTGSGAYLSRSYGGVFINCDFSFNTQNGVHQSACTSNTYTGGFVEANTQKGFFNQEGVGNAGTHLRGVAMSGNLAGNDFVGWNLGDYYSRGAAIETATPYHRAGTTVSGNAAIGGVCVVTNTYAHNQVWIPFPMKLSRTPATGDITLSAGTSSNIGLAPTVVAAYDDGFILECKGYGAANAAWYWRGTYSVTA
jgi:hypothetical protein